MSIIILNKNKGKEKKSTYQIHFFYLLLAGFQYLILLFLIENVEKENFVNFSKFLLLPIISSLLGGFISKKIDNKFISNFIDLLAFFSCLILISKIFFSA